MVERALQIGDDEGGLASITAVGESIERAGQFGARDLVFTQERAEVVVVTFAQADVIARMPEAHRAIEGAQGQGMTDAAILLPHPIDTFGGRIGLGWILDGFGANPVDLIRVEAIENPAQPN